MAMLKIKSTSPRINDVHGSSTSWAANDLQPTPNRFVFLSFHLVSGDEYKFSWIEYHACMHFLELQSTYEKFVFSYVIFIMLRTWTI